MRGPISVSEANLCCRTCVIKSPEQGCTQPQFYVQVQSALTDYPSTSAVPCRDGVRLRKGYLSEVECATAFNNYSLNFFARNSVRAAHFVLCLLAVDIA